jgi:hypothetical protein
VELTPKRISTASSGDSSVPLRLVHAIPDVRLFKIARKPRTAMETQKKQPKWVPSTRYQTASSISYIDACTAVRKRHPPRGMWSDSSKIIDRVIQMNLM